jgi:2-polyprenyl-3-methyl-5-hydroxy-6-metoxy-1,4-benzoquinol methylase
MAEHELSPRQRREREFYTQFAAQAPDEISFDTVRGDESRPENPYWFVPQAVVRRFTRPGQRLLDFGCGPGLYSVLFASVGYEVHGFDIAPANVAHARRLAERYGVADRTHLSVGMAEALDHADDSIDVVVGVDILHHVDIGRAMREVRRVLKPGGVAIFREPVAAPLFDALRNTRVVRAFWPNSASLDRHTTEDERKLSAADLRTIRELFPDTETRYFRLFSRLTRLGVSQRPLERADQRLLRALPALGRYCGTVVLTCPKS